MAPPLVPPPYEKGGYFIVKKELAEYLRGERNVVKDEFILGRELAQNSEYIVVGIPGYEEPLYALFNSRKNKGNFRVTEDDKVSTVEKRLPKGTGGEPAYVMIMLKEYKNIKGLNIEAKGLIMGLIPCLEWNTCRLVRQRDGKSLTRKMISRMFGIGFNRTKDLLSQLIDKKVLKYDVKTQAYYMDNRIIRKGVSI